MTNADSSPTRDRRLVVLDGSHLAALRDWRALADVAVLMGAADAADGMLLDVRRALFTPASGDVDVLVAALSTYAAVAIVSGANASFGCARMVSTLIECHGSKAAAFFTAEEAEAWLSAEVGCELGSGAAARTEARL